MLAGLILSLHTVFPHVHAPHGEQGEVVVFAEQPDTERSLLEVLYELVTADLGEEHLEHFAPADVDGALVLSIPPAIPLARLLSSVRDQVVAPQKDLQEIIAYHPLLPDEAAFIRQRPLRGPPTAG